VAAARTREPLARLRAAAGPGELAGYDAIDAETDAEIEAAVAAARAVPFPDPATVREHVYV
jgi:TPP-dependent pyruvate/acetoin dehydrogenase alpha subunit